MGKGTRNHSTIYEHSTQTSRFTELTRSRALMGALTEPCQPQGSHNVSVVLLSKLSQRAFFFRDEVVLVPSSFGQLEMVA